MTQKNIYITGDSKLQTQKAKEANFHFFGFCSTCRDN